MNIFQRAKIWAARRLAKAAAWPIFPKFLRYSFMDISFRTLAKEGYKKNSAVFACVQALAFGFSEPPAYLYRDGAPDPEHPVSQLLASPNPDMGWESLLQYVITYASIGGNCYLLKTHNAAGQVVELWPLHDGQMEPVAGGDRLIKHYRILGADGQTSDIVPREDVVHFRWAVDPLQPWRGMGALVPAAREVDLDSEMTAYTFSLLKNNAVPPLALVVPPGEILEQFQIDRMKQQWIDNHGGENRGKPAVLEGGMDVKQLSFDVNKLAAEAMRSIPESRISAVFKVPAVVAMLWVGLQQMTYNNVAGMMRYFTEQTLTPLWRRFAGTLTRSLAEDFNLGNDEVVHFDTSQVVALQQRTLEIGEHVERQVRSGVMMRNEARDALGLQPVQNGDVFLIGMSTLLEPASVEGGGKALRPQEAKATDMTEARRNAAVTLARVLQSIRKGLELRMAADVERFFRDLAATVVERARSMSEAGLRSAVIDWKRAGWEPRQGDPTTICGLEEMAAKAEQLTLPNLFRDDDFGGLLDMMGFWTYTIIEESWETWNQSLGVELEFTRNDPAVVSVVETLGDRISLISEGTLNGVREILAEGYDRGWSIDHIVAGDPEAGVPGLAETVGGLTYRGPSGALIHLSPEQRARMVARTELGTAQNRATTARYGATGVERVRVLDDGFENSHEFCKSINGKVVPLEWAQDHALCHPNCVRALAPEYDAPVDEGAIAEAEKAGTCPFG